MWIPLHVIPRLSEHPFNERCLCRSIAGDIGAESCRELPLHLGILCGGLRVLPKVVAEEDRGLPHRALVLNDVHVVRPWFSFAEE